MSQNISPIYFTTLICCPLKMNGTKTNRIKRTFFRCGMKSLNKSMIMSVTVFWFPSMERTEESRNYIRQKNMAAIGKYLFNHTMKSYAKNIADSGTKYKKNAKTPPIYLFDITTFNRIILFLFFSAIRICPNPDQDSRENEFITFPSPCFQRHV